MSDKSREVPDKCLKVDLDRERAQFSSIFGGLPALYLTYAEHVIYLNELSRIFWRLPALYLTDAEYVIFLNQPKMLQS